MDDDARARDLGIELLGPPGPLNSLTDVAGVEVGYLTLPDVHTGVTAILPRGRDGVGVACAAGRHVLNGAGEMTGSVWIDERGALDLPIMITGSPWVGAVHSGTVDWVAAHYPALAEMWLLPPVAETWDGYLADPLGHLVRSDHAGAALDAARSGPVAEGSVGGGTGMRCYGYKAGSGTSSRIVDIAGMSFTVGVFVQANFGARPQLTIAGVPVGRLLVDSESAGAGRAAPSAGARPVPPGAGSVIVIVGTDAPLLPDQCRALARRVPLGLARTGTTASHFSGDLFLAFSTANPGAITSRFPVEGADLALEHLSFVPWGRMDPLFDAVVQATEEAVLNALVAGRDTVGRLDRLCPGLPLDEVRRLLARG